jgi:hypothetical protein
MVHDVSYIRAQILLVWRQTFFRVLAQVFIIVLITLLIVRWSIAGPIARAALWMRALRTGKISFRQEVPDLDMFRPLVREVATMAESLSHARNAAENEARLREAGESMWTADRLSVQLRTRLDGGHMFVVSNREPYMHQRNGKTVEVVVPPSGLVTALEPVLTPAMAPGSPTAAAMPTPKSSTLQRPAARSSGGPPLQFAPRLADQRGRRRLLLRLCQRRPLAALPYRTYAPAFSRRRLAALSGCQPQVRGRVLEEIKTSRSLWCSCRIITSPCCRG